MLSLYGPESQKGESLQRREMLKIGGLGLTGLGLPQLLDANHGKLLAGSPSLAGPPSFNHVSLPSSDSLWRTVSEHELSEEVLSQSSSSDAAFMSRRLLASEGIVLVS